MHLKSSIPKATNFEILFFIIEAFYMNLLSLSFWLLANSYSFSTFCYSSMHCNAKEPIKLPSTLNKSDLGIPVIRSTHNPLVIKSNTANKLLMPFQNPQTCSTLNIPEPGERDWQRFEKINQTQVIPIGWIQVTLCPPQKKQVYQKGKSELD